MIDRGIEMQFLFQVGAFRGSTRNPNRACSIDFGKLPDQRPDGPAGSRDHNGFAFLRFSNCFHSRVGTVTSPLDRLTPPTEGRPRPGV